MTSFVQEAKNRGYNVEDAQLLKNLIDETKISDNQELEEFLSKLDEKFTPLKSIGEIYARTTKLIPYQNLDINAAYRMFQSISNKMTIDEQVSFDKFFRTPDGENVDVSGVSKILARICEKSDRLVCISLLYFISEVIEDDENDKEEKKDGNGEDEDEDENEDGEGESDEDSEGESDEDSEDEDEEGKDEEGEDNEHVESKGKEDGDEKDKDNEDNENEGKDENIKNEGKEDENEGKDDENEGKDENIKKEE